MRHDRHEYYRHYAIAQPEWQQQGSDMSPGTIDTPGAGVPSEVADTGLGRYAGDDPTGRRMYDGLGRYVDGLGQSPDTTITVYDPSTQTLTVGPAPGANAAPAPAATGGGWWTDVLNAISGTAQAVAQTAQSVAPALVQTASIVAPAALSIVEQNKLAAINNQRAAAGLAPLTAAQYQQQYMITPGVNVGLTPDTTRALMWGGGILLGVVVLVSLMPRRAA
jgi:hypothetical protein